MRWKGRRASEHVQDRRRMSPRTMGAGGGLLGLIVVVVVILMGGDPRQVLQLIDQNQPAGGAAAERPIDPAEEELAEFVRVILASTEDVWQTIFANELGQTYVKPDLVLFTGVTSSGCGHNSSATGPFYCPADSMVYIDLSFFEELKRKFGAPGDFAQAYVIAHEVGHHVQNLLGISDQVNAQRRQLNQEQFNQLSVRLELQADYLAGVWAHHSQRQLQWLEPGDVEEALNAANAIGDDRLQRQMQGRVSPESFTHGTSKQRMRWFSRGLQRGDFEGGDTFRASEL